MLAASSRFKSSSVENTNVAIPDGAEDNTSTTVLLNPFKSKRYTNRNARSRPTPIRMNTADKTGASLNVTGLKKMPSANIIKGTNMYPNNRKNSAATSGSSK